MLAFCRTSAGYLAWGQPFSTERGPGRQRVRFLPRVLCLSRGSLTQCKPTKSARKWLGTGGRAGTGIPRCWFEPSLRDLFSGDSSAEKPCLRASPRGKQTG